MQPLIEFHTHEKTYIVTHSPESVRSLFQDHDVNACDLQFTSDRQRKQLTKNLFLLALQEQLEKDELAKQDISPLALLARKILV